jgi:hypothetical protein
MLTLQSLHISIFTLFISEIKPSEEYGREKAQQIFILHLVIVRKIVREVSYELLAFFSRLAIFFPVSNFVPNSVAKYLNDVTYSFLLLYI